MLTDIHAFTLAPLWDLLLCHIEYRTKCFNGTRYVYFAEGPKQALGYGLGSASQFYAPLCYFQLY